MENNAKIVPFFYKERKERKDRNVVLKRTDAQPWFRPSEIHKLKTFAKCLASKKESYTTPFSSMKLFLILYVQKW